MRTKNNIIQMYKKIRVIMSAFRKAWLAFRMVLGQPSTVNTARESHGMSAESNNMKRKLGYLIMDGKADDLLVTMLAFGLFALIGAFIYIVSIAPPAYHKISTYVLYHGRWMPGEIRDCTGGALGDTPALDCTSDAEFGVQASKYPTKYRRFVVVYRGSLPRRRDVTKLRWWRCRLHAGSTDSFVCR